MWFSSVLSEETGKTGAAAGAHGAHMPAAHEGKAVITVPLFVCIGVNAIFDSFSPHSSGYAAFRDARFAARGMQPL